MPIQLSGSLAITGSLTTSTTIGAQGAINTANTTNPISFTSTASLYSDGGMRLTKDLYVSGTSYFNNVTVYGTQSVQYITSSQLNIGTNIISVNTDVPTIRFGGLSVYDSGSTGLTGSILWDSEANHWVYTNPSGSTYSGGMFISGPRSSALGSEQGTTSCMLLAGQGGDHLTSSMIYHSSIVTCIPNTLIGSTVCSTMTNASCIGIGTNSPTRKLTIEGSGVQGATTGASIRLDNTTSGRPAIIDFDDSQNLNFIASTDTGNVRFITGTGAGSEKVRIDASGNLMVGSVSAGNAGSINLSVGCAGTTAGGLQLWATNAQTHYVQFGDGTAGAGPYAGYVGYAHATDSLLLGAGAATRAIISSTGVACFSNAVCVGGELLVNGNTININCTNTTATDARINLYTRNSVNGDRASIYTYNLSATTTGCELTYLAFGYCCTNNQGYINMQTKSGGAWCNTMNIINGNVGIGTTSPTYKLDVNGSFSFTTGGNYLQYNSGILYHGNYYQYPSGNDYLLFARTSGGLNFGTNDAQRLSISSTGIACFACQICAPAAIFTGCVGIGTTSPSQKLSLGSPLGIAGTATAYGSNDQGSIMWSYEYTGIFPRHLDIIAAGSPDGTNGGGNIRFFTNPVTNAANSVERMRITSAGRVGIGQTGPGTALSVAGQSEPWQLALTSVTGTAGAIIGSPSANVLAFGDWGGTERMRITSAGSVGIGTTSPSYPLTRNGMTLKALGTDGAEFVILSSGDSGSTGGALVRTGVDFGLINRTNGCLIFATNTVERMWITNAGSVGIGCASPSYVLDVRDGTTGSAGGRGMRLSVCSNSAGPQFRLEYQCTGDSRNWMIGTNQEVAGDFIIRSSTIAGCDPGGASSATRFSISKDGSVGIGTICTSAEANLFLGAKSTIEGGQMVFQKGTSCSCATHLDNYNDSFRIMSGTDTGSTLVNMTVNHATGTVGIGKTLSITTTALHGIKTFESGATSAFTINLPVEYPNLLLTGGNVWGVVGKALFFNGGSAEVRDFYIARNSGGSWSTANYGPSSNTSGGILQSVAGSGTCITINMNSNSYVTVELTTMVR